MTSTAVTTQESFVELMTPKDSTRIAELAVIAKALALSGFFKDLDEFNLQRGAAQALTKILRGQDLGISPTAAVENIFIIENRTVCSSHLMSGLIRRSGASFEIVSNDERECIIDFFDSEGKKIGQSSFTIDDAELADLLRKTNWKKYPADMCFSRAIARGFRRFFSHLALGGLYTPEELGFESDRDMIKAAKTSTPDDLNVKLLESTQDHSQEIADLKAQLASEDEAESNLAREGKKESKEEQPKTRAKKKAKVSSESTEEEAPSVESSQVESPHINHDSEFAREVAALPEEWPKLTSLSLDDFVRYCSEFFDLTTEEVKNPASSKYLMRFCCDRLETAISDPWKLSERNRLNIYQLMSRARERNKHDTKQAFTFVLWCWENNVTLVNSRSIDQNVVVFKKQLKEASK